MRKSGNSANNAPDVALWNRRTDEILDCAAVLFAERGYDGADVQELANRLNFGKGTVYRCFPSKRELFLAAADRAMRRLREHLDVVTARSQDPLDQVAAAIEAFLSFFDEYPQYAELLILERALFRDRTKPTYMEHREKNLARWEALYESLIQAGRVRPIPVDRITAGISDLVYGTMFSNHIAGRKKPLGKQAGDIVDIVFFGILSESERVSRREDQ